MNLSQETFPRRKRGLILTLSGSLLFHGSLIGVAALWTTHPVAPISTVTQVDLVDPEPPGELLPPAIPPSEPEAPPPVLKMAEPVDNPPPVFEPGADDMSLATPAPHPVVSRTPSHPMTASTGPRTVLAPGHVSTSGPAGGNSGSGLPGAGTRWNKPKPAYPAPARLAHIQGNGSVRVTTDASGRVVNAAMVQSTGNPLLDDTTCRAARSGWSGPPNSSLTVPVTYQLQ